MVGGGRGLCTYKALRRLKGNNTVEAWGGEVAQCVRTERPEGTLQRKLGTKKQQYGQVGLGSENDLLPPVLVDLAEEPQGDRCG